MTLGAAELLGWTTTALADLERDRGWTEKAIERLELTWHDDGRVGIPIRDEALEVYGELRYDPTRGQRPKMLAPSGAPRVLFPPPEAIADHELDEHRTVWLVEGEPDAIRMWSLGLPAVAVPGGQNWRDEWAARFTGRHLRIVVCFDCDQAGRKGAGRAAAAIAAAGVDARLVELDADRDDGYDLTDYAAGATSADDRAQLAQLLAGIADRTPTFIPPPAPATSATASSSWSTTSTTSWNGDVGERPWRSTPWSTFRDTAPPAQRWLIDGLVPAGALCFVAGPPKRGKTWIGISLALALALGQPFAGEHEVPMPRDVLYIALEGSQTGLRTRIGALARGAGVDPDGGELERLHMLYRPRPFDLAEVAGARWLVDEAEAVGAALVAIDVLRAAARFDENAASDFNRIRDQLDPLLAAGVTVALLHHFGKLTDTQKERSPGERMAGTGAMYGALDVGFLLTRSSDGARRLRVDVEARDFAAPDALELVIAGDGGGKHGGFRYIDTATLEVAPPEEEVDVLAQVLELLADGKWRIRDEIATGTGLGWHTLQPVLEAAIEAGRIVRVDGGDVGRKKGSMPYGTPEMRNSVQAGPSQPSLLEKLGPANSVPPTGGTEANRVSRADPERGAEPTDVDELGERRRRRNGDDQEHEPEP